jgi:hypothetical protein
MAYPTTAPETEPRVLKVAKKKLRAGVENPSARRRISGGRGKKEASANAIKKSAHVPTGVSAQCSIQA